MRRSIRGLRFLPHQNERGATSPCNWQSTNQHAPWHPNHLVHGQDPSYCHPSYTPVQCNGYNGVGSNVNYHYYHHSVPNGCTQTPCQCCPPPTSIPQLYSQHRYTFEQLQWLIFFVQYFGKNIGFWSQEVYLIPLLIYRSVSPLYLIFYILFFCCY